MNLMRPSVSKQLGGKEVFGAWVLDIFDLQTIQLKPSYVQTGYAGWAECLHLVGCKGLALDSAPSLIGHGA